MCGVCYRVMLGRPVDLFDIRKFDASLGISLEKLHAAYRLWASGPSDAPLVLDGALIEDLFLTFVLPGRTSPQFAC